MGLLVTIYSLGMGFGGPTVAWALRHTKPKRALIPAMTCYAVAEAAAGAAIEPVTLSVLRFVTGSLSGATFGLALTVAMALSGDRDRPRVPAMVLLSLMAATLLGLPLSHLLATWADWRASFLTLVAAAVVMAIGVAVSLPSSPAKAAGGSHSRGSLRSGPLWARIVSSFLTIGGAFTAFASIDQILQTAALTTGQVTLTMLGFGIAALAFAGNYVTGRVTHGRVRPWLLLGLGVQLAALLMFPTAPQSQLMVVLAAALLGGTGIALNPLLVHRVVTGTKPDTMVNTVHTSAITLGVAAATAIGSRAIHTGDGDLAGPSWWTLP